jgi:hypothetical protein
MPSRSTDVEHRRQSEATAAFDDDRARRSRGRTHAAVEEGEGRSWGAADDRARASPFRVSPSELQGVDAIDECQRQRFTELG